MNMTRPTPATAPVTVFIPPTDQHRDIGEGEVK